MAEGHCGPDIKTENIPSIDTCRPITLLSCVFKVMTVVMHNRLSKWSELYQVILRFLPHRSTCHHIVALLEAVESTKPVPLFVCFVDLTKAHDSGGGEGFGGICNKTTKYKHKL